MKTKRTKETVATESGISSRTTATRDWSFLITLFSVLVVLSAGWNLWLLYVIQQGGVLGDATAPGSSELVSRESVEAMFEARRIEEQKYRQQYRFVDPSL